MPTEPVNALSEPRPALLARRDYVPANVPELLRLLRLPRSRQQDLQGALGRLEQAGRVACIKGYCYILPREADVVPGRIRMNRQGKGFLQPDDVGLKEIAIPESATGTALHEDRVLVRRDVRPTSPRQVRAEPDTGTVVRILERRRTRMVGTLQRGRRFLYVIPDDPRIPHDIYVPEPRDVGRAARMGDKVVVELKEWKPPTPVPRAKSSRCWARRTRRAWTCCRCCASTICRGIFRGRRSTRRAPTARPCIPRSAGLCGLPPTPGRHHRPR